MQAQFDELATPAVPETPAAPPTPPSERPRALISLNYPELLAVFLVLLLFSWLGIKLSNISDGVATIWFTNGMLFALIILRPRRNWLPYFAIGLLADTLADVLYGDHFALAFGVSVANSVEVILSAFLLTWIFGTPFNLSRRRPLVGFLLIAVIGATAVTSALGASWTLLFVKAGPWLTLFRTWYLGDILGMSIMAPLTFILLRPGFFRVLHRKHLLNTLALLTIPAIATVLVFTHSHDPLIFFIFPALLLVVFRLGFPGTVLSLFVIAIISIGLTVRGYGPLILVPDHRMLHRIVVVQIFLAVALFTSFPVAALLEERKELEVSLQQSETRYRLLANHDGLTGLTNRRYFDDLLAAEWDLALTTQQPLALLMIDVDLFKRYNDLFGHVHGDACLRQIANTIADTVLRTPGEASRFGGEEFTVILPNTDSTRATAIAEDLRSAITALRIPHTGNPWHFQTVSIGLAVAVPELGQSPLSLLNASDSALYLAKLLGRNRVESNLSQAPIQLDPQDPDLTPIPPGFA
ncbi:MAG: diguanylate cyclase [Acidobacteriaceae bacterium]